MTSTSEIGRLTVLTGPMFSGKTGALLESYIRAELSGLFPQLFKPSIDNRGEGTDLIHSRTGASRPATPIVTSQSIFDFLEPDNRFVGIDEIQFFDSDIVPVVRELTHNGLRVVTAGLPTDFRGEPFGSMPTLLAIADEIQSFTAICTYRESELTRICANVATRTQRLVNGQPALRSDPLVLIGDHETYEARCPQHHFVPN